MKQLFYAYRENTLLPSTRDEGNMLIFDFMRVERTRHSPHLVLKEHLKSHFTRIRVSRTILLQAYRFSFQDNALVWQPYSQQGCHNPPPLPLPALKHLYFSTREPSRDARPSKLLPNPPFRRPDIHAAYKWPEVNSKTRDSHHGQVHGKEREREKENKTKHTQRQDGETSTATPYAPRHALHISKNSAEFPIRNWTT